MVAARSPARARVTIEAYRLRRYLWLIVVLAFAVACLNVVSLQRSMLLDQQKLLGVRETVEMRQDTTAQAPGSVVEPDLEAKTQFARSLWTASAQQQQPQEARGIVLPLYDAIATLGMSLVLELRATRVNLSIEIPHCGDLGVKFQRLITKKDPLVRTYDVCATAAEMTTAAGAPLFCESLDQCHKKFRGFDIKIISLVLSRFQQIMLMDADTLYFQSPMLLWDSQQYKTTGTFFFHDRIGQESTFLTKPASNSTPNVTVLEAFLSRFDVTPFRGLPTLNRTIATAGPVARARAKPTAVALGFEPSDVLLTSHSWNRRSGHEVDSSLLLWDKNRQPRATAVLAWFVSMLSVEHPPGYGDKELFFLACELAETDYAFSDVGVGSIGVSYRVYKEPNGHKSPVLCGDAIQFLPSGIRIGSSVVAEANRITDLPLYFNGDSILRMKPRERRAILRTRARAAEFYNGSNRERRIPLICLMDMKVLRTTAMEQTRILQRQNLHSDVLQWLHQPLEANNTNNSIALQ